MVDAVNTVGASAGSVYTPQSSRSPVVTTDTTATTTKFTIDSADKASTDTRARSLAPRLLDDPTAGVLVTETLDAEGDVVAQTPTSSVLAYLRNGLTIDGRAKQSTTA
jgi:hypothetical protein